jgi:hypothetical protein
MRATLTVALGIRDGWLGPSAVRAGRSRIKDAARHGYEVERLPGTR